MSNTNKKPKRGNIYAALWAGRATLGVANSIRSMLAHTLMKAARRAYEPMFIQICGVAFTNYAAAGGYVVQVEGGEGDTMAAHDILFSECNCADCRAAREDEDMDGPNTVSPTVH
jgi:hypothetical protein